MSNARVIEAAEERDSETSAEPRASRGSGLVGRLNAAIDAATLDADRTCSDVLKAESARDNAWAILKTLKEVKDS